MHVTLVSTYSRLLGLFCGFFGKRVVVINCRDITRLLFNRRILGRRNKRTIVSTVMRNTVSVVSKKKLALTAKGLMFPGSAKGLSSKSAIAASLLLDTGIP